MAYLLGWTALLGALFALVFATTRVASAADPGAVAPRNAGQSGSVIVVDSLNDTVVTDGACTLREAVINANANTGANSDCAAGVGSDTITFDISGTITLTAMLPDITGTLSILGDANPITISGAYSHTVLGVSAGATLALDAVTIAHGLSMGDGGGVKNEGTLTVTNVLFSGNAAANGGAVANILTATVTVSNSRFICNSAGYGGGALYSSLGAGSLRVSGSLFTANRADVTGGAIEINSSGPALIETSAFLSNTAVTQGGAVKNYPVAGTLVVEDSTFAFNRVLTPTANQAAGGGIDSWRPLTVTNSTFHGNAAGITATNGIAALTATTVLLRNSIIDDGCVGGGTFVDGGHNLESGARCGFLGANNSRKGMDVRLLPLADNGGPTPTFALSVTSPAINAGNNAFCAAADQRGSARPVGPRCDIGAYELDYTLVPGESVLAVNSLLDTDDGVCNLPGQGVGNQACTLREAIGIANAITGSDTITFDVAGTLMLDAPLPDITGTLGILAGSQAITISGSYTHQVFNVPDGAALWLDLITVANGFANIGGAIQNDGVLTLTNAVFTGNAAEAYGGAIVNYGALVVSDTRFVANTSGFEGGAIHSRDGALTIGRSVFISNTASSNGGALAVRPVQTVTVDASTFVSNTSLSWRGGAIHNNGISGTLRVVNSTFAGNAAPDTDYGKGGGLFNGAGRAIILNSTFSGNASPVGGAIAQVTETVIATTTIINSIVADGCAGAIIDGGHNIEAGTSCGFSGINNSRNSMNARLLPLTDNGGPAPTFALSVTSPAINAGNDSFCAAGDQRGVARPVGPRCDIGAYELVYTPTVGSTALSVNSLLDTDDGTCDLPGQGVGNQGCTLREAIGIANAITGSDAITIDVAGTITLAVSLPDITGTLSILGNAQPITVSGAQSHTVFRVPAGAALALDAITVTHGYGVGFSGGGVDNAGVLTVTHVLFSNNRAGYGGAISSILSATVTVSNSRFISNSAGYGGGAIYSAAGSAALWVSGSLFTANHAAVTGGAIEINSSGLALIENSAFLSNTSVTQGGAVNSYPISGSLQVEGSTFAFNRVLTPTNSKAAGGGIESWRPLTVTNSTFHANVGGITATHGIAAMTSTTVLLRNSIIDDGCAGGGAFIDSGTNLERGTSCGFSLANNSYNNTDARLLPPADNGGPTPTMALSDTSPAVNMGEREFCTGIDQRGATRPFGPYCDIGAYELSYIAPPVVPLLLISSLEDSDDGFCDMPNYGFGNHGCTLREAIRVANVLTGANSASFVVSGTITLRSPTPAISEALTLLGAGSSITVSGANTFTVFTVSTGAALAVDNITITRGYAWQYGGGIANYGTLTVTRSALLHNRAGVLGGAVANFGSATITESRFISNTAGGRGGALYSETGLLVITRSLFMSNTADIGGALDVHAGLAAAIASSSFVSNTAATRGGAINSEPLFGSLGIVNSTFGLNRVLSTGLSMAGGGGIASDGVLTITNSTFHSNTAANGAGVLAFHPVAMVMLRNTIVNDGCSGGVIDGGHNIDRGASCGFFAVQGSLSGLDAGLMPLVADDLVMVFPLTDTSPAINAGDNASCPALDQRGLPRSAPPRCDVGAYELGYLPPAELSELIVNVLADTDDGYCSAVGVGIGNKGCSLREAMTRAPLVGPRATITVTVTGTIALVTPLPEITRTLSLISAGQPVTVSGSNRVTVLSVASGAALALDAITIADGYDWMHGGGIKNDGTLTVTYATFTHNQVLGGGWSGGAIVNRGTATILDSRFISNSASYRGGAIYAEAGQLRIQRSVFIDNYSTGSGGAIEVASELTTTIGSSAFFSNTAAWGVGGAIANGALSVTLAISNSVFGYNRALWNNGGAIFSHAPYTVTNSTFHGNSAGIGGAGVYQHGTAVTFQNTIVNDGCGSSGAGAVIDGGHNIDGGSGCGFDTVNGSLNNTDARLQPMAYVGLLPRFDLRDDSPAINTGNNATCTASDMMGVPRPYGIRCDIGALELSYAPPAQQSDLVVNVLVDTDDGYCSAAGVGVGNQGCSLREAMLRAPLAGPSATITVAVTGTITLGTPLLEITRTLSLLGAGQPVTVSGSGRFTVLSVANGAALTLDAIAIADGYSAEHGGGIQNDGTLTVSNATFMHNRAPGSGDAGGAIASRGPATIVNSRFISNTAGYRGGAVYVEAGPVRITRGVFIDNLSTGSGGALEIISALTATIDSSAFLSNTAAQGGGGAVANGATAVPLLITNTVFGYNRAPLNVGGAIASFAAYTVTNATFHGNSAGVSGAGLHQHGSAVTLRNTIVNDGCASNGAGAIIDGGNNIDRGTACGFSAVNFSKNNTDARLLPLHGVESDVPGFPLDFDSPAINAGNNATCPSVDQRGVPRPIDLRCEIGALEFDYLAGSYGATFVVNTLADTDDASCDLPGQGVGNQDCSLREAIFLSNLLTDTNMILFSVDGTITLGALLPQITHTLEIIGAGRAITISGAGAVQVLSVLPGAALTVDGIAIADGGNAISRSQEGGAIHNQGALTIRNARFFNNQAGINGGAIMNGGIASITTSRFVSNSAGYSGGAVFSLGAALTVKNSVFTDNRAESFAGAIFINAGVANLIEGNAFVNNVARTNNGGAIVNVTPLSGTTTIVNSTFAGNRAGASNELVAGVFNLHGALIVINSTFSATGAALRTAEPWIEQSQYATTTVVNTIIAGGGCVGVIVDGGHNLDSGSSCGFVASGSSRSDIDARLGPLGDNGGDTLTLLPAADSPALEMGDAARCPALDQRGVARPQGGRCDIGAVEQAGTAPPPPPPPPPPSGAHTVLLPLVMRAP